MADSDLDLPQLPTRSPLQPAGPDAGEPSWLALKREDLAALVAGYRGATRNPRQRGLFLAGLGGLGLSVLLMTIRAALGWPEVLDPIFLALGWVILLSCGGAVWRHERRARAQYQLECPACHAPLLDDSLQRVGPSRAELAIASGCCPSCGERILEP